MPYYDYKCTQCGEVFEINKGMNDPADPPCPQCRAAAQRIFYAPRINRSGTEQKGSCSTCKSGVCSSCSCH